MARSKYSANVAAVIATVKAGQRLCKFIRKKESGDSEIIYFYEPSGRRCGPKSAEAAIESGELHPNGDGLFDLKFSQSWSANP